MRINIEHTEKKQGMVFKKTLHGVSITINFSQEELQIIKVRKLERTVILERETPADVNEEKHADRGLARKLATAAIMGADANHFHLTIGKLMRGTDTYYVSTPLEAKAYEAELKEALPLLKQYITENEGITERSSTFEL